MRKPIFLSLLSLTIACQPLPSSDAPLTTPFTIQSPVATQTQPYVYLTPTPGYPQAGFGPTNFPIDINPLTGLSTNPYALDRRPLLIKVSNLPRDVRPQFGLSRADIVYEYYTEEGTTRFIAIYYSLEAEMVGSIRSARFFDEHIIRMYKGLFAFGSADKRVLERLENANFSDRLLLEWEAECPALCRPDPVTNYLIADTGAIREYVRQQGISDELQNLEGMHFQAQTPDGGERITRVFAWYSAVIYNRWDYDPPSGRYYRYVDVENALAGQPEVYQPLRDALVDAPIRADNVVILLMPHDFYSTSPEIVEMWFSGSGPAYAFRDGLAYELEWVREAKDDVLSLITKDGKAFPFKPGTTWFEVMGIETKFIQKDSAWRFEMRFP
ncbi:MAG: DUF3048 domain-containing protein [Anaerolineae bacterium]|nr:DUF3048 domain-containing protein [Anaerolineae bacterium]